MEARLTDQPAGSLNVQPGSGRMAELVDLAWARQVYNREPEKHSLLYPSKYWKGDPTTRIISRQSSLQCGLSTTRHNRVHQEVPFIPPFTPPVAAFVLNHYRGVGDDPLGSLDELVQTLKTASYEAGDLTSIDRATAQLAIQALVKQRYYLT